MKNKQISRRKFIGNSSLAAGAFALAPHASFAADPPAKRFDPFETVALGKTGLKCSRVAMGTGVRGGMRQSNHTRMGREKCEALMRAAYDRGVRLFDLADLYGTHPFVLSALKNVPRKDLTIVSKIWFRPGGIPEPERPDADVVVQRFLKEIGTDYLDLVLLHCVESPTWPQELQKQMEFLATLKTKGAIRAHGVSCHSIPALEAAAKEPWVDSVHARINPYGVRMDGPVDDVVAALKKISAAGKAVVGMKIIGEGEFRNDEEKRNASVKFALNLGCVNVLNVGFEKAEEIDDFAERVRKVARV